MFNNKYQLLSGFDTLTRKPLRVYAMYMQHNKFGLIDVQGKIITKPWYDAFPDLETTIGLASHPGIRVMSGGFYGIIDFDGAEILPTAYDAIRCIKEEIEDGVDPETGSVRIKIVFKWYSIDSADVRFKRDAKGRIFDLVLKQRKYDESGEGSPYGNEGPDGYGRPVPETYPVSICRTIMPKSPALRVLNDMYEEGEVYTATTHKYGFVDRKTGDTLIPAVYDRMVQDNFGRIHVFQYDRTNSSGDLQALYSIKGDLLVPLIYEQIDLFNGIYLLTKNGKTAHYDSLLNPLSGHIYDKKMSSGNDQVLSLAINGKYALIHLEGKAFTEFEYDQFAIPDPQNLPFPMIIATKNGKQAIMDFTGKLYTGFDFDVILAECHVSFQGDVKLATGSHASNHRNAFFFVKQNALWGIMDTNFQMILPCVYENMGKCYDRQFLFVCQNTKWSIVNLPGQSLVYPITLSKKPEMKRDFFVISKENRFGVIRKDGSLVHDITLPGSPRISKVYEGLVRLENFNGYEELITYIDDYGNTVSLTDLR